MQRSLAVALTMLAALGFLWAAVPAAADTDDFAFDSFHADYTLGVDDEGRSTLTTVETLVAVFPDFDQNRGILRALVATYDGHPTDIEVVSVTDENGVAREWHEADDDEGTGDSDFLELAIVGADYLRGEQTFVITYEQHNVTRFAGDAGVDEFYWDVNGLGWNQPFGSVSATVSIPADLADTFVGEESCYMGGEDATEPCDIATEEQDDGSLVVAVSASDLGARENVTIAVAFEQGTFVPRDGSFFATPLGWVQLFIAAIAAVLLGVMIRLRRTTFTDAAGRPTIIAEYTPPPGLTLLDAALLMGKVNRASAAQLIDLAVRRNIRILEEGADSKATYAIEFVSDDGLVERERSFLRIFFGELEVGDRYTLVSTDAKRGKAVYKLVEGARKAALRDGLRRAVPSGAAWLPIVVAVVTVVAAFVTAIFMVVDARGGVLPFVVVAAVVAVAVFAFVVVSRVPLTERGAELRDHLEGLRVYIELAEADRLRFLQSPEGALRTPVSATDPAEMLALNERLLPYSVLFSLEKRWAEEIGRYYDDNPPEWYAGSGSFNAVVFAASIGSLSSSTSSAYSGTAASSSSSGSGGSGSSGGGGGGGGGGGL